MRGAYDNGPIPCPYCGGDAHADFVDIGVGLQQAGPFHCVSCEASEVGPYDDREGRDDIDPATGWYKPGAPAGSSANVDESGKIITHYEADTLYRTKVMLEERRVIDPRYDDRGRSIPSVKRSPEMQAFVERALAVLPEEGEYLDL